MIKKEGDIPLFSGIGTGMHCNTSDVPDKANISVSFFQCINDNIVSIFSVINPHVPYL